MDVAGKKVENQVQFWSLLGPFFVLLSIAVLIFKVSPHWYFPVSALIGIPLCLKWKMKGLAAALGCLLLLAGVNYFDLELDDRYWHVGLSLAMAFSFIVLTLSLEESHGLIAKMQLESLSRLDNFLLLDEKWKSAEQEWIAERERVRSEAALQALEIARIQEEKQTFYKLAQLSKEELVQVRSQYDLLVKELQYKKQQIFQLLERMDENDRTIQNFVDSEPEKQIQSLIEKIALLDREKETLKAKISVGAEERKACLAEKEMLLEELLERKDCLEKSGACIESLEKLKIELEAALAETKTELERTEQQLQQTKQSGKTPSSDANTRPIEALYLQLKEQFQEKCAVLDATRRDLFHLNEELLRCKKEYEEKHLNDQSANEKHLQRHIAQLSRELEHSRKLYEQEISELTQLVDHFMCKP